MSNGTQIDWVMSGARATVTFHTEGGLNVMSQTVLERLGEVVQQPAGQKDVRFCTLQADGKVFIAGANIKEMAGYTPEQAKKLSVRGNQVLDVLAYLPCVTVAALQGAALGGGCEGVRAAVEVGGILPSGGSSSIFVRFPAYGSAEPRRPCTYGGLSQRRRSMKMPDVGDGPVTQPGYPATARDAPSSYIFMDPPKASLRRALWRTHAGRAVRTALHRPGTR